MAASNSQLGGANVLRSSSCRGLCRSPSSIGWHQHRSGEGAPVLLPQNSPAIGIKPLSPTAEPWDVCKKSLVLAIRLARDRVLARERQAEGVAKGLVNRFSAGVLLRGGQGSLSCVADLDMVLAALDQLDLVHVGVGCP